AFSRKQVLQPRVVELRRVVGDISTLLRRLLGSIVEYRLRLPPEPLWVRADESQLEQVVLNLVINARDAMPNGGVVTAELDRVAGDSPAVRRHPAMPPSNTSACASATPASAWTRPRKRASSSRFSPPRSWAKAPDSGSRRSMASSSRAKAGSGW